MFQWSISSLLRFCSFFLGLLCLASLPKPCIYKIKYQIFFFVIVFALRGEIPYHKPRTDLCGPFLKPAIYVVIPHLQLLLEIYLGQEKHILNFRPYANQNIENSWKHASFQSAFCTSYTNFLAATGFAVCRDWLWHCGMDFDEQQWSGARNHHNFLWSLRPYSTEGQRGKKKKRDTSILCKLVDIPVPPSGYPSTAKFILFFFSIKIFKMLLLNIENKKKEYFFS